MTKREEQRAEENYQGFCAFAKDWLIAGEGAVQRLMVVSYFRQSSDKYRHSSQISDDEIADCLTKWNQEHNPEAQVDPLGMYLGLSLKPFQGQSNRAQEITEQEKIYQIKTLLRECKQKGQKPPVRVVQAAIMLGIIQIPKKEEAPIAKGEVSDKSLQILQKAAAKAEVAKKLQELKKDATSVTAPKNTGSAPKRQHSSKKETKPKDDDGEFHWDEYKGEFEWNDYNGDFSWDDYQGDFQWENYQSSSNIGSNTNMDASAKKDSRNRSKSPSKDENKKTNSSSKKDHDRKSGRSKSPTRDDKSSRSKSPTRDDKSSRSKSPTRSSKDEKAKSSSRSKSPTRDDKKDRKHDSRSKSPSKSKDEKSSKSRSKSPQK